ncbi:MAG: putative C-S lyase [Acholeplasmatales bacterium]|nr:MAG: putative C-S lyase [Acholeplasmatales bacterium]
MNDMFETLDRRNTRSAKWQMAIETVGHDQVLAFSVADSDYETAPCVKAALKKRLDHGAYGYTLADDTYKTAVLTWFERRYGWTTVKENVLVTSKVLTALSIVIESLTDDKDAVVIQTPVYHVFYPLVKQQRRKLVENPLLENDGRYRIDFKQLEACFAAGVKMLVFCSPHNPVGRVWREDELLQLIHLCKHYGVWLVSDEIHADLILPPHRFLSVGQYQALYDRLIVVQSAGKTFNLAGLQTANLIVFDKTARTRIKQRLARYFLQGSNLFGIEAVIAAYTAGDVWVDAQNRHVDAQAKKLETWLDKYYPTVKMTPLEGTYLAWLNVSALDQDGTQFEQACHDAGVVVSAGKPFSQHYTNWMRLNLACSSEQLDEGLKRLGQAFNELMKL